MVSKTLEVVLKAVMAVMFLSCLLDWPYTYFQLVRSLGMIGFIIIGVHDKRNGREPLSYIWFCSALLINPVFKVSLGRDLLNLVDIIWALILLYSIRKDKID